MLTSRLPLLLVLSAVVSSGCRSSDPLAGTWSNTACYGSDSTPADIESCSVTLTFADSLDAELQAEWVSMPATANFPGCITTKVATGQTWSTKPVANHDVLQVTGNAAATVERSGCVNDSDNMDATATSDFEVASGDSDYQITDGTLTFTSGDLTGSYQP